MVCGIRPGIEIRRFPNSIREEYISASSMLDNCAIDGPELAGRVQRWRGCSHRWPMDMKQRHHGFI